VSLRAPIPLLLPRRDSEGQPSRDHQVSDHHAVPSRNGKHWADSGGMRSPAEMNWKQPREAIGVTGMGVFCASAHGVEGFDSALRAGVSTVTFHEPALGLNTASFGCSGWSSLV